MQRTDLDDSGPVRKKRIRWLFRGLFLIALVAFAVVIGMAYFPAPYIPAGPVTYVRDAQGRLVADPDSGVQTSSGLQVSATRLEANNSQSSVSTSSSRINARFACNRLLITGSSANTLLQQVGQRMPEHLQGLKGFRQVSYHPAGSVAKAGTLAPDVMVVLRLDELQETAWPGSREVHAKVHLDASRSLDNGHNSYSDSLDPPLVGWRFSSDLDHRSKTKGISSPAARLAPAADNIAQQLAKSLQDKLNELYDKHRPLPQFPSAFYPAYTPSPQFELPAGESLTTLGSYRGFMASNDTLWSFHTTRSAKDVLTALEAQLTVEGWKTTSLRVEEDQPACLRMKSDESFVSVYSQDDQNRQSAQPTPASAPSESETSSVPVTRGFFVRHVNRMKSDVVRAGIDVLLQDDRSLPLLLALSPRMDKEQRQSFVHYVESRNPQDASSWLMLAERARSAGDEDKARTLLRRAQVLGMVAFDEERLEGRLKDLAKKLKVPKGTRPSLDAALMKEIGFTELTAESEDSAHELEIEEAACFYVDTPEDGTVAVAVWIGPADIQADNRQYRMTCKTCRESMRSVGSGGMVSTERFKGVGSVLFVAKQLGQEPRFRLTVKVQQP